jgi:outer membrane immunogenic protein
LFGTETIKEIKQVAKVGLNYKFGNPAGSSAMAAYAAAPPAPVNWTGCYIGAHVGGGWHGSSFTSFGPFGGLGPLGGGQVGCNYQWQQFVVGLEGEFWGSGLYDSADQSQTVPGFGSLIGEIRARNRWDAGISARMGYAFERAFLYGKLGGVWGKFDYNVRFSDTVSGDVDTTTGGATFAGVLIGAGFEYALAGNWTAKFEYNYIDYGERSVTFTDVECSGGVCVTTATFTENHKERKQLAKLGLNYRFGGR